MIKPVIDAKEVLDDIRSGMTDVDLMNKYNLSSLGLQSLFKKLTQAGVIKEISPKELLRDINAGFSPSQLMEKYKTLPIGPSQRTQGPGFFWSPGRNRPSAGCESHGKNPCLGGRCRYPRRNR